MVLISIRNGNPWRGMTSVTRTDLGDRRFRLLENCYVSHDGSEIRTMPGFKTAYDFETVARSVNGGSGYYKNVVEKGTPVVGAASGVYQPWTIYPAHTVRQEVWSKPLHIFGFKRIRNRLHVYAEDDFRREPIRAVYGGVELVVTGWTPNPGLPVEITMSGAPLVTGSGNPANSVDGESIVWIEGNDMPPSLRGKMHRVIEVTATGLILDTEVLEASPASPTAGTIARVRVGNAYSGVDYPISQYDSAATFDRPSLISYLSTERPEPGLVRTECYPSMVFNRQPDSGDAASYGPRQEGTQASIAVGPVTVSAPLVVTTAAAGVGLNQYVGWIMFSAKAIPADTPTYARISANTASPNPTFTTTEWSNGAPGAGRPLTIMAVGFPRRGQLRLPYRPNPDATVDRILLGTPGYGCAFEIPAVIPNDPNEGQEVNGAEIPPNDLLDKPRCIGIPKGQMWIDTDGTATSDLLYVTAGGGAGAEATRADATYQWPAGTYSFRVAYRDDATGEVGLASEPVTITTAGAAPNYVGIRLFIMHPGYLMAECGALTVLIYRTVMNSPDGTYYLDAQPTVEPYGYGSPIVLAASPSLTMKYGITPLIYPAPGSSSWNALRQPYGKLIQADLVKIDDAILQTRPTLDSLVQMPAPSGVVRTTRGITLYANRFGSAGFAKEMVRGTFTSAYDNANSYPDFNQVTIRNRWYDVSLSGQVEGLWGLANPGFPHGLQGLGVTLFSATAFPYPFLEVKLGTPTNSRAAIPTTATNLEQDFHRWTVVTPFVNQGSAWSSSALTWGRAGYVNLPRGRWQFSPVGRPWQTPIPNLGYADAEGDEDIEGVGTFGGGFLIATRTNTYSNSFIGEPRSIPDFVSGEFGCIAPNTFVEFDGGTAWISDRGPVAYGPSGMQWIGRDLEQDFVGRAARYKRDYGGRMRHAWGCHDKERGLVIFGLFADREADTADQVVLDDLGESYTWGEASDELRSRFPCDELLVWSYRSDAWARWKMPPGLEVLWMEPDIDSLGTTRMLFLARDRRIYMFDDGFVDSNMDPIAAAATNSGTGVGPIGLSVSVGTDITARGTGDNLCRVGMSVAVVRSGNLVAISRVASFTSNTVTLEDSTTWQAGDQVYIGSRISTVETNFMPTSDNGKNVNRVLMRYWLSSDKTNGEEDAAASPAFVKAEILAGRRFDDPDSQGSLVTSHVTIADEDYPLAFTNLGQSASQDATAAHTIELANGVGSAPMISVRMTLIGPAQIKISDILLETA